MISARSWLWTCVVVAAMAGGVACHKTTGGARVAAAGSGHWSTLKESERIDYMKKHVMPVMGKMFHEQDKELYDDPTCTLCHGKRALDGDFTMPNPKLPRLSTDGKLEKEWAEEPEMTRFMIERVVPEMVRALRVESFERATGKGFGCFNCHTPRK